MIIFNLDGTLANCDHRRHFVDPSKNPDYISLGTHKNRPFFHKKTLERFKPDWKSFYEACDRDIVIDPVKQLWDDQVELDVTENFYIWSGRCESFREETEEWLEDNLFYFRSDQLKMRPLGDSTPDDELKERWLNEAIAQGEHISYVFDDSPKVVRMWRSRGIFVFNCNQSD